MKFSIRNAILLISLFSATITVFSAATRPSAAEVMRRAAEKLHKAPAVEAVFTATHAGRTASGQIILSGNRFKLTTDALTTWFDGKTQWAYSTSAAEVNVSEPTSEELSQINPFEIIRTMQKDFTPRRLTSGNTVDKIELLPKGKSEYSKVVLTLNATTLLPSEIVITSSDRSVTVITLSSVKVVKSVAKSAFTFNSKLYPGVDIVDLR